MSQYYALDERSALDYIRRCAATHDVLPPDQPLLAEEIGDGNLNLIFRMRGRQHDRSVIVKQALPYVR
jgi:5-methylthioribose kinase